MSQSGEDASKSLVRVNHSVRLHSLAGVPRQLSKIRSDYDACAGLDEAGDGDEEMNNSIEG